MLVGITKHQIRQLQQITDIRVQATRNYSQPVTNAVESLHCDSNADQEVGFFATMPVLKEFALVILNIWK